MATEVHKGNTPHLLQSGSKTTVQEQVRSATNIEAARGGRAKQKSVTLTGVFKEDATIVGGTTTESTIGEAETANDPPFILTFVQVVTRTGS